MMRGFYFEGELFVGAFVGTPQPLAGRRDTPNVPSPEHPNTATVRGIAVTAASLDQVLPSLDPVVFVPAGSSDRRTLPAPCLVMFIHRSRPSQRNVPTSGKPPDSPGNSPLGSPTRCSLPCGRGTLGSHRVFTRLHQTESLSGVGRDHSLRWQQPEFPGLSFGRHKPALRVPGLGSSSRPPVAWVFFFIPTSQVRKLRLTAVRTF